MEVVSVKKDINSLVVVCHDSGYNNNQFSGCGC